ncbi:fimbrial protein [Cronobacter universalis]|uniref:fimbrial protein n=1 Tax=Cronobacter universalis TaxID=535744 RepID=UPI0024AF1256|nr:fimbrial protein [Cronobacter universalis]ELY7390760.1 type 1 fimbrial protein [Cronobacter universalis]MDI7660053.1 fimbrial protein [Cronobacter universalis]
MKKLILGSAIVAVLGVASNAMAANSGTVKFTGSVSTATCNLNVKDSAGSDISAVDLGSVATNAASGTVVSFKLIPKEADCLTKAGASMSWTSSTLNATGLGNSATNGTNAVMTLMATNATATDKNVKQGNTTFDYNVTGGIKSFDYSAALAKPNATTAFTAGLFSASANYTVAYK